MPVDHDFHAHARRLPERTRRRKASRLVMLQRLRNVLALAGFSPMIQSVRLHYVEFFSKFYAGGGRAVPAGGGGPGPGRGGPPPKMEGTGWGVW
jgi:hypothetical protein